MREDFRPLWDAFRRDGVDIMGPGHLSEEDRKAGIVCVCERCQSYALGSFIQRLLLLGFTCKDENETDWF